MMFICVFRDVVFQAVGFEHNTDKPLTHISFRCEVPTPSVFEGQETITVSFHNFKSRNFKLSVSNAKSKYVAYLSVLSQISNCQGLGRKNKHEILKTDRIIQTPHPQTPHPWTAC